LSQRDALYHELAAIVGAENVHVEGEFYDDCTHDATEIRRTPLAAIAITNAEQVPLLLRLARAESIPIIPRGAGTGYTGGAIAEQGGIVLSFIKMNRILQIDEKARVAIAEPGVITQTLADAVEAVGLFYPPDPASVKESAIGGNVAECAGGLRCKKYGLTKDYVVGIEGYDIDGDLIRTGCFAEQPTYDLMSLLIGSEGTMIVITRIAVKLIDLPQCRRTFLATFNQQHDAAEVVSQIMAAGIIPAVLEFMDHDAIAYALTYLRWTDMKPPVAALLIELDGSLDEIERDAPVVIGIIKRHSPERFEQTEDEAQREHLWTLRRSISKAIVAATPLRVAEDVCVPPSRVPELVAALPGLGAKHGIQTCSYGHAGDGNLHVNFLMPEDTPAARALVDQAVSDLFTRTIELDGTISGEHGIGITKKAFLPMEVSPATMALFTKLKSCFDPPGLVNPGKMFD
jgi:glycolate oxidase